MIARGNAMPMSDGFKLSVPKPRAEPGKILKWQPLPLPSNVKSHEPEDGFEYSGLPTMDGRPS